MVAQSFGDEYTKQKLQTVERYLKPYATALNGKFKLLYVDACAGSGASIPKSATKSEAEDAQQALDGFGRPVVDSDQIVIGSALRALSVTPPFHRYLFNDLDRKNVQSLIEAIDGEFAHLKERIITTNLDANEMLRQMAASYDWRETRAVVFLDPFGLQIKFETLEILAQTRAIDLWYLVPVFAMYRQVSGDGEINPDGGPRVDAALGTTAWRNSAVKIEPVSQDLFEVERFNTKRAMDIVGFETFAKERLASAFGGRVLDKTLPLGKNGVHYFSLMFAWANPSSRAEELAKKFAAAVLK
ncbi:MAG: three-Cys-motif partner protein TcmP [Porphyrobacter sp.]|nr:three-Cys-motif partner protein TcmP [Porphyrobacter sp.]